MIISLDSPPEMVVGGIDFIIPTLVMRKRRGERATVIGFTACSWSSRHCQSHAGQRWRPGPSVLRAPCRCGCYTQGMTANMWDPTLAGEQGLDAGGLPGQELHSTCDGEAREGRSMFVKQLDCGFGGSCRCGVEDSFKGLLKGSPGQGC